MRYRARNLLFLMLPVVTAGGCLIFSGEEDREIPLMSLADVKVVGAETEERLTPRNVRLESVKPKVTRDGGIEVVSVSEVVVVEGNVEERTKDEPEYYTILARVSSYCPCTRCCGRRARGLTKLETSAWEPGIACDWTWLSPGTIVEIPGYGKYPIDDEGGRLKKRYWTKGIPRLDKRRVYHWQAQEDGVDYVRVKIFKRK